MRTLLFFDFLKHPLHFCHISKKKYHLFIMHPQSAHSFLSTKPMLTSAALKYRHRLSMPRCIISGRSLYLLFLCKPRPQRLFGERLYRTDLKVARAAENPSRAVWRLTPVGYHQRLLTIKKAVSEQNRGFDLVAVQHQPQVGSVAVVRDRHLLFENRATKPFRIKVNRCSTPCCWRCRRSGTEYFISGVI